jgi:hypothetical protein
MAFYGNLQREGNRIRQERNPDALRILTVEQFGFSHFLNGEIFHLFDSFAETGVNGFRCFGFWPYGEGQEEEPYVRLGWKKYDLNRFNEPYFDYLKEWLLYAYERSLLVRYELFDRCGLTTEPHVSGHHPYNATVHRDERKFSDYTNEALFSMQKRYVQKVVSLLREFPNVIIGIMNEFTGYVDWHCEMSRYVRSLAPDHLISGTCHGNPAIKKDREVDLWWVHTGTYDFDTGTPHVQEDIADLRDKAGDHKALGFSTDGFGNRGRHRENPADMARLAEDANQAGIQLFSFLDHKAYNENLPGSSLSRLANIDTYVALANMLQPTPLGDPLTLLPEGVFSATRFSHAPCTHPLAFIDENGRAVKANRQNGFLFFGNYQTGYPQQKVIVVYVLYIDNNTYDDAYIAILDVVKNRDHVVASRLLRRREFPHAGAPSKLTLPVVLDDVDAEYETRVFYLGNAYLAVNGVYVVDPSLPISELPDWVPYYHQEQSRT